MNLFLAYLKLRKEFFQTVHSGLFYLTIVVLSVFLFFARDSIGAQSMVEGKVIHAITGESIVGVPIIARTSVMRNDDKDSRIILVKTNERGRFIFKDLLPKYGYIIIAKIDGYTSDSAYVLPNPDKVKIIEKPLRICPIPPREGIFIWHNNGWNPLIPNSDFTIKPIVVWGRLNMTGKIFVNIHIPTNLETNGFMRNFAFGRSIKIVPVNEVFQVSSPPLLAIRGGEYLKHKVVRLYFYPNISLSACLDSDNDCDPLPIPEGYHAGVKEISAIQKEKSLLLNLTGGIRYYTDIARTIEFSKIYEFCNKRVGALDDFVFGYLPIEEDGYYAIISNLPYGPFQVFATQGANIKIPKKIQGIVIDAKLSHYNGVSYPDEPTIAMKTICNDSGWDNRFGIYWNFFYPAVQYDMNNIYRNIEGVSDRNKYYNDIINIVNGVVLIESLYGEKMALEVGADVLSTIGFASDVFDVNDYAPIVIKSLSESIRVFAKPDPASIATNITMNTFSIVNNTVSAWAINKKRKKYEVLSGVRDVMFEYYRGCGNFRYLEEKLRIKNVFENCETDRLSCTVEKYLESFGFYSDIDQISSVCNNIVGSVKRIHNKIGGR